MQIPIKNPFRCSYYLPIQVSVSETQVVIELRLGKSRNHLAAKGHCNNGF